MNLIRIEIQNFRCIDKLELFPKNYTSLIGPNNAGKSAVLRAIEIFLNQEKPEIDEWRKGYEVNPIIIESEFADIQVWERKTPGIAAHVYDNKIKIRMTATVNEKGKVEVSWESFREDEQIEGWPENATFTKLSKELQDLAKENDIDATSFKKENIKETLRSIVRDKKPNKVSKGDAKWTSDGMSIPAALQQALPQAQLIPAIRDASADGTPGAKTSFGLLLDKIILPAVTGSSEYQALITAVEGLQRKLHGKDEDQIKEIRDLAKQISDRVSELITAKISLQMESPNPQKFIGSNTMLRLDDGTLTRIGLQGHGLQRALIFAMLEVLAIQSSKNIAEDGASAHIRHTILLFEEPELFIHPHLMRRLKETLSKISKDISWQVMVTTHSPFLVDVGEDPCSLVIHRRSDPSKPPTAKQLKENPLVGESDKENRERLRAVLDFHPSVCEAFFAKHVVLVEGDTEVAVLVRQPELYKLADLSDGYYRDVTVVSCDGKWTIIPMAKLLRAFGVPTRIIHDEDRKKKTDEELEKDTSSEFHANKKIAEAAGPENVMLIKDTFEDVLWESENVTRLKKDKPFRAWKRVREICNDKNDLNHAPKLKEVVEFVFKPFT